MARQSRCIRDDVRDEPWALQRSVFAPSRRLPLLQLLISLTKRLHVGACEFVSFGLVGNGLRNKRHEGDDDDDDSVAVRAEIRIVVEN